MASLNFNHAQSNSKKWAKKIKLPQMKFFLKKQLLKFSCTHSPLSFCKILKQFLEPIQSYEDKPFLGPKWPICPEQIFFGTNYYYFYPPIGPFHCAKFKKNFLQRILSYEVVPFWGPKWPICLKNFFGENY